MCKYVFIHICMYVCMYIYRGFDFDGMMEDLLYVNVYINMCIIKYIYKCI
jgi:hypothetical protein